MAFGKFLIISLVVRLGCAFVTDHLLNLPMSKCAQFKYEFANLTSIATSCFIQFSQPLRICMNCRQDFLNLKDKYNMLIDGRVGTHQETNCADNLLRSDLTSSFDDLYTALDLEWTEINCENCYKNNNFTNRFLTFIEKETSLLKCFEHYTNASLNFTDRFFETIWDYNFFNQTACNECRKLYFDLTNFYEATEQAMAQPNVTYKFWEGVCGDLGDMMNTTRYLWSNKFLCDQRKTTLILILPLCFIIVCSLLFCCLVSTYFHNRVRTVLYRPNRLRKFKTDSESIRETSIRETSIR